MKRTTISERALVLAPRGRDAAIATAILQEAGFAAELSRSIPALVSELNAGAGFVVIAEEALATSDLNPIAAWIDDQQEWSDLPFVLLTIRGGGLERNPAARRYLDVLGNVTFLERPFHPTTLVSLADAALRGRRKQYEARSRLEALGKSESQLRLATEAAEIGLWDLDVLRDALFWPPRVKAMFGISPDAPISMAEFYAGLHPDDAAATRSAFQAALDPTQRALYDVEYRAIGKEDGVVRWIAAKGRGVFDEKGRCTRVLGTAIDVTARKVIEERLRKFNELLELRVAERTAELVEAQEALRQAQKLEAVGQLTGGVAHDFNNLLTIIKSSTDFLRRSDLSDERRRRYVDAISDTVERASKLTGQLLSFARRQALKPEVFDMAERLEAIADMLRTIVGSRIPIVTQLGAARCFVEADISQFETAIVNMAVNARDAMNGEGRLTIRVGTESRKPESGALEESSRRLVAVSLTDTGAGIPPDKLPHIFEPFYTTKEIGKGTGLGLSQVYGFAKQSGGDVVVDSQVGRGTTFTIFLPRAADPEASQAAANSKETPAFADGRGHRVLVVEDNAEVGAFSTQLLQDLGYETIWAANAEEALAILAKVDGFDAVFSDVVMPGMNGVELGREIHRRNPGLPVILTSGYSQTLAEEGRLGFELLRKPYAADELSQVLRRSVRGLGSVRGSC